MSEWVKLRAERQKEREAKNLETVTAQAVASIRVAMMAMTCDQRVALLEQICAGYCAYCGSTEPDGEFCQCRNDE
jgi:hypothetical protein